MGRPHIKRVPEKGKGSETAAGLVGYSDSTANYTSAATDVDGAISALDTQVKANADAIAVVPAAPEIRAGELAAGVTGGATSWQVTMGSAMPNTDYAVSIGYLSGFNVGGTAPTAVGTWQVTIDSTTQFTVAYVDNTGGAQDIDDLTFRWIAVAY